MDSLLQFVTDWNNRFPYDRVYRKKYNIPFGSPQHRQLSQIDIFLDIVEELLYSNLQQQWVEQEQMLRDYRKTGDYVKTHIVSEEEEEEAFKKIDISIFNKKNG